MGGIFVIEDNEGCGMELGLGLNSGKTDHEKADQGKNRPWKKQTVKKQTKEKTDNGKNRP